MSTFEASITNSKKQLEFYKQLSEKLQQENKQLKDNIRQMDNSVDKLQKQLIKEKDNWNKLKEYIYNQIPTDKTVLTKHIKIFEVLDKMQELEGSDSNENNNV